MHWMVPERMLDQYQLDILTKCGGTLGKNEWIKGFAGSGKTVLLVHLVQRMLVQNPDKKICVAVYTHALKDLIDTGFEERFRVNVPVMTYHQLLSEKQEYDLVILDEVQDIPVGELTRIKELAGRLVVAGDTDQSIYEKCSTSDEITATIDPRPHQLIVLYRLTQKVRDIVQSILPGSQIEGARTNRMQEVQVTLAEANNEQEEIVWVWYNCRRYAKQGDPTVVLLPTHKIVQKFISKICKLEGKNPPAFPKRTEGRGIDYEIANRMLEESNIPLQYLGSAFGNLSDSDERPLTYIMTYHSAKGLDFETVFLPHINKNQTFWWKDEEIDRRLFFVGATRSRKNLFLSYSSDDPHEYIQAMPQNLLHKVSCEVQSGKSVDDNKFYF